MTTQSAVVYLAGVGMALAVAVPLHRALRRGSRRFNALAVIVVGGVLALAASIAFLTSSVAANSPDFGLSIVLTTPSNTSAACRLA